MAPDGRHVLDYIIAGGDSVDTIGCYRDRHMKAMQGGMAMMKEMHGMHGTGGMAGTGEGKGMPADMAQRHQMMTAHMATMQTMMDMMMQRIPATPAAQ